MPSNLHRARNLPDLRIFAAVFADQSSLMATEHDRDLLLMTFRLLPNLDSIGVRAFDGRTGLRNVDYGLKTLRKELGIPNSYRDRNYDWRQPYWKNKAVVCLQRLLYAAGMTNVRPKILKVVCHTWAWTTMRGTYQLG
jgi:hypothetical protein